MAYLTATATLSTGEESGLASPFPWVVPTLAGLWISGPASLSESGRRDVHGDGDLERQHDDGGDAGLE